MRPRLANLKHCRHPSRHPTIRFGIFHLIQAFLTFVMHRRKRSVHARVFLRVLDVAVSSYMLSDTVLFSTVGMCVYPQFVTIFPSFLPILPPCHLATYHPPPKRTYQALARSAEWDVERAHGQIQWSFGPGCDSIYTCMYT